LITTSRRIVTPPDLAVTVIVASRADALAGTEIRALHAPEATPTEAGRRRSDVRLDVSDWRTAAPRASNGIGANDVANYPTARTILTIPRRMGLTRRSF